MDVLVCYGSKRGSTRELAEWIGHSLQERGNTVDVGPARDVTSVAGYDAAIIGGALYVFRWHRDAKRVVRRYGRELSQMPVWLFSSGPLDDSAAERTIPPVRFVRRAMERIGARGHMTFGGRLEPGGRTQLPVGDWRDKRQVEGWVEGIAADLAQHVETRTP
jgi:menaquinone-dependent protoporphyrinogen oxidase